MSIPFKTVLNETICFEDTITFNGQSLNTTGTYRDTFSRVNSCDSFVVLNLTVSPQIITNLTPTICYGDSVEVGTSTYTTSGVYADTIVAANGCDSIINTTLTVNTEIVTNLNETICYGDSVIVGTSVLHK